MSAYATRWLARNAATIRAKGSTGEHDHSQGTGTEPHRPGEEDPAARTVRDAVGGLALPVGDTTVTVVAVSGQAAQLCGLPL